MIHSPDGGNKGSVPFFSESFAMSSYFDEHDCTPLADGTAPDELLQFARFENATLEKRRVGREF